MSSRAGRLAQPAEPGWGALNGARNPSGQRASAVGSADGFLLPGCHRPGGEDPLVSRAARAPPACSRHSAASPGAKPSWPAGWPPGALPRCSKAGQTHHPSVRLSVCGSSCSCWVPAEGGPPSDDGRLLFAQQPVGPHLPFALPESRRLREGPLPPFLQCGPPLRAGKGQPPPHTHLHLHVPPELQQKAAKLVQDLLGGGRDVDLQGWKGGGQESECPPGSPAQGAQQRTETAIKLISLN